MSVACTNRGSDEPVRIGVIGYGRFGRLHALTLAGLAEAQLVGLVARRKSSFESAFRELPGIPAWTNLQQAIHESDAKAWVVACSTASHVHVTRQLLEAGKIVLLEKPVANNLGDAMSLGPLVKTDSSNLMMGHIVLFNSEFQQLLDEVRQRGPISYVDSVRHRPASIVNEFPGENPLHAVMIHDLYATQVMLDRAEPGFFSACYHRTDAGEIDLALAQLKWKHGAVASFSASFLTPAGMPPRGFDRTEIFGDGWSARINPNPRPIEVWDTRTNWPLALEIRAASFGPTGMMAEELRCFCRVVRGQQEVPVGATYADALQVQKWMDKLEACAQ
ncbi:MAG: Gfo/Idh/MocA family oxidoreductase [Planctomycetota bacterium]|nr:Gfo/Idh/MocA family oxidoreductase [Planctomycetota bacterium]